MHPLPCSGLEQEGLRCREMRLLLRKLYLASRMMEQEELAEHLQSPAMKRIKLARSKSRKKDLPRLVFIWKSSQEGESGGEGKKGGGRRAKASDVTARLLAAVFMTLDEGLRRAVISYV